MFVEDSAVNMFVCCLFATHLELGADGGPSVLETALQGVLFVSAQDVFKQIVDKVQPGERVTRGMLGKICTFNMSDRETWRRSYRTGFGLFVSGHEKKLFQL